MPDVPRYRYLWFFGLWIAGVLCVTAIGLVVKLFLAR